MNITINNLDDVYKAKKCSVETMELKGFELIEELFTDSSGFGAENEPALTISQFQRELKRIVRENGSVTAKITNVGQFQCYVGLFKKTGKSKVKTIANNTLEVVYSDTKHAIRLHDTDIITFDNGDIILNTGGWKTVTTKARINQFLPSGSYNVFQKDYEWFVHDLANETIVDFKDGMVLEV